MIHENTDLKLKLKQIKCKSNTDGKKIYVAVLKLLIKLYGVKTVTFWISKTHFEKHYLII